MPVGMLYYTSRRIVPRGPFHYFPGSHVNTLTVPSKRGFRNGSPIMASNPMENQGTTVLKKRAVAGSFLFRYIDDGSGKKPQVALFRRSGEVRTYQYAILFP